MILSMLFVYPMEKAAGVSDSRLKSQKGRILNYWHQTQCPNEDITNCYGVGQSAYDSLRNIGLREKSTQVILKAISDSVGNLNLQQHLMLTSVLAKEVGKEGFTIRVTELGHPDGFDYLAIGFVS